MKTHLDLYQSAHAAAVTSLNAKTRFEVDTLALNTFKEEEHEPADYETWRRLFDQSRQTMAALAQQQAPSVATQVPRPGNVTQMPTLPAQPPPPNPKPGSPPKN